MVYTNEKSFTSPSQFMLNSRSNFISRMFSQLLFSLLLISTVECAGNAANCNRRDGLCNSLYMPLCCDDNVAMPRMNEEGEPLLMYAAYCNMNESVVNNGYPFPFGCCQRCNGESDMWRENCFDEDGGVTVCCPGYTKQSPAIDPACREGQYSCVRNEDELEVQMIDVFDCFTEGQFCSTKLKCCNGTICDATSGYGTCQPDPDYTGPIPPPTVPYDLPTPPVADTCQSKTYNLPRYVPPTTLLPTTPAPTTTPESPTTPESATPESATTPESPTNQENPMTPEPPMKCRIRNVRCVKTWYNPLTWLCYLIGWGW